MVTSNRPAEEPLFVTGFVEIDASVGTDATVRRGGFLRIHGNLRGNLTIEQGGTAVIEGVIEGRVANRGGKLVVGNREFAESSDGEGPPVAEAGGVFGINLSAIARNYSGLARRSAAECAAVLKADAYGCGLARVVPTLMKFGCKTFFVTDLAEARRLRAIVDDVAIFVLNGLFPGNAAAFAEVNAKPVIGSLAELVEWDAVVAASGWTGGYALHVDIGKSRAGVPVEEALSIAARSHQAPSQIALLMGTAGRGAGEGVVRRFQELRWQLQGIPASLAGSAGIFLGASAQFDMVRPGSALFGVNPTPGAVNPMNPVVDLAARIVQVRSVAAGETFGCRPPWTPRRASRVALVAVGIADGYPLGRAMRATVGSTLCPVVGRVSADWLAIDVSEVADRAALSRGEMVTLIGGALGIDAVAAAAGLHGGALMAQLRLGRFHRRYYQIDHVRQASDTALP